jgi:hypothetical protein
MVSLGLYLSKHANALPAAMMTVPDQHAAVNAKKLACDNTPL